MSAALPRECSSETNDVLEPGWRFAIYALIFAPVLGPPLLFVGSSILYYAWRSKTPQRATEMNRHAWIACGIGVALQLMGFEMGWGALTRALGR